MGRIAVINPGIQIQKSITRFPDKAEELLLAQKQWQDSLARRSERLATRRGEELYAKELNFPKAMVEPGVWFKRDYIKNKSDQRILDDGRPNGAYVDFYGTAKVPMGDWDFPDAIHHDSSVTIKNLGDTYQSVKEYTNRNPDSLWQMYLTPGGVRGFEIAEQYTPRQFMGGVDPDSPNNKFAQLNIDPNYAKMAVAIDVPGSQMQRVPSPQEVIRGVSAKELWNPKAIAPEELGTNLNQPTQAFHARVSSKPGRAEDFVAYPLGTIGTGITNPYNQRILDEYHDLPIMRSQLLDGMKPGTLPKSGIELLDEHLRTVPDRNWSNSVEQRLERLGLI
jgi:hypothetical protein